MFRYLILYLHIFNNTLKGMIEHRLNFFVQLLYGPMYIFILFMIMNLAYSKAPVLGGWSREEGLLLFSTFQFVYMIATVSFLKGVRILLWEGLRVGDVDKVLTKPVNPQFYLLFSKPEIQQIIAIVGLTILFGFQLAHILPRTSLHNALLFFSLLPLSLSIIYFSISIYATSGFYTTRSQQIIELFDKVTDYAHYPMTIFPESVKLLTVTILPVAFFSYVPVSVLLGKADWSWVTGMVLITPILGLANQVAWREGLKRYSSASS